MKQFVAVAVAVLVVALIVLGLYGLCHTRDGLVCLRDVAIITLALAAFAVTVLLLLIVVLFGRLISAIQEGVTPILASAKRTADTVQGTTAFVSDTVVAPLINIASLVGGTKGTLRALLSRKKSKS